MHTLNLSFPAELQIALKILLYRSLISFRFSNTAPSTCAIVSQPVSRQIHPYVLRYSILAVPITLTGLMARYRPGRPALSTALKQIPIQHLAATTAKQYARSISAVLYAVLLSLSLSLTCSFLCALLCLRLPLSFHFEWANVFRVSLSTFLHPEISFLCQFPHLNGSTLFFSCF